MLQRIYGASAGRARFLNIAMLIAGYGFGQGSLFVAQTWLLAQGKLKLLALFGTHFSFALFGIILVEAGSLVILARHSAHLPGREAQEAAHEQAMWRKFWETSIFRASLALLLAAAIAAGALWGKFGEFSRNYALCAAPAYLIWSVNGAGFLDGLKLSGVSGISGSVAFIASAAALLLVGDASAPVAGLVLGGAFTAGYGLTVLIQAAALHAAGWRVRFERPTRAGVATAARDGFALLGSTLPGQFLFRAQLLMSSAWLGAGPTAMLVYIKQIVSAAAQMIGFIRRVEFPALVTRLAESAERPIASIMRAQRLGTWLAVAITLAVCAAGLVLTRTDGQVYGVLGWYLALFSISITTNAVVQGLGQGLAALGRYHTLFVRSMISTSIGLALTFALIRPTGLAGIVIAELAADFAGALIFMIAFGRVGRGQ